MDPRAYRVAQEFMAQEFLRRAKYKPEFLMWTRTQTFRNPETDREVQFQSLPGTEQKRIYRQWAKDKGIPPEEDSDKRAPQSREETTRRNLDIARQGKIVRSEPLSSGGQEAAEKGEGVNESFIVTLEHDGQQQTFIHKPAKGEEKFLRVGIPGGTYHAREQAAYGIDALLGGGGVVPATITRGSDDGSYQLWAEGAKAVHGEDLDELVKKVSVDDLPKSPDFERMNVMDLLLGHEDRHQGNVLHYFEGDEETPENLRFVAIDNGLSLSSPNKLPDHHAFVTPFGNWYNEEEGKDPDEQAAEAKEKGDKVVAKALSNISPELHERIKKVDLGQMAKGLVDSGVDEEGAVRAALNRMAALQEDPKIFQQFLKRADGKLDEAWREFQFSSGQGDDLITRATEHLGGALARVVREARASQVSSAVETVKPSSGWSPAPELDNYQAEEAKRNKERVADFFGDFGFGPTAKPPGRDDDLKTRKEAARNVRDRWLRIALHRATSSTDTLCPKRP